MGSASLTSLPGNARYRRRPMFNRLDTTPVVTAQSKFDPTSPGRWAVRLFAKIKCRLGYSFAYSGMRASRPRARSACSTARAYVLGFGVGQAIFGFRPM